MIAVRLPPQVERRLEELCSQNWSEHDLLCARGHPAAPERWRITIWPLSGSRGPSPASLWRRSSAVLAWRTSGGTIALRL